MLIYRITLVLIILFILTSFSLCAKQKEKTKEKGKEKEKEKTKERVPVIIFDDDLKNHCDLSTIIESNLSLCENKVWLGRSQTFFSNVDLSNKNSVKVIKGKKLQYCLTKCLEKKKCYAVSIKKEEDGKFCYLIKKQKKKYKKPTFSSSSWTTYELKCCTLNLFSVRSIKNTQNETIKIYPMVFKTQEYCTNRSIYKSGISNCTHIVWRIHEGYSYTSVGESTTHYNRDLSQCLTLCQRDSTDTCSFISFSKYHPNNCQVFNINWNSTKEKNNFEWVSYVRMCCVNQRKGKEVTALPVQPAKIVPVQPATEAVRYSVTRKVKGNPIGDPSEYRSLWAWYSALPLIPLIFVIVTCVGVVCYCKKKKEKREKADKFGHLSSSEDNHLMRLK